MTIILRCVVRRILQLLHSYFLGFTGKSKEKKTVVRAPTNDIAAQRAEAVRDSPLLIDDSWGVGRGIVVGSYHF